MANNFSFSDPPKFILSNPHDFLGKLEDPEDPIQASDNELPISFSKRKTSRSTLPRELPEDPILSADNSDSTPETSSNQQAANSTRRSGSVQGLITHYLAPHNIQNFEVIPETDDENSHISETEDENCQTHPLLSLSLGGSNISETDEPDTPPKPHKSDSISFLHTNSENVNEEEVKSPPSTLSPPDENESSCELATSIPSQGNTQIASPYLFSDATRRVQPPKTISKYGNRKRKQPSYPSFDNFNKENLKGPNSRSAEKATSSKKPKSSSRKPSSPRVYL